MLTRRNIHLIHTHPLGRSFLASGAAAVIASAMFFSNARAATYQVTGTGGTLHVHTAPSLTAPIDGNLPDGTSINVTCQIRSDLVGGSTMWDRINYPVVGFVADWFTTTPAVNSPTVGLPECLPHGIPQEPESQPTTQPQSNPSRSVGRLATRNGYPYGQCTYLAEQRFAEYAHHFPQIGGDAWRWARTAIANDWTVVPTPEVNSVVVFQRGENGASKLWGHVAWVTAVNGSQITVEEMNVRGLGVLDTRSLTPGPNARFILAA